MTTANAQIAQHLNILESAIAAVEEWAHVLFVRFIVGRPRFVSKKVIVKVENKSVSLPKLDGSEKQVAWAEDIRSQYQEMVKEATAWLTEKIAKSHAKGRDTSGKESELNEMPKLSKLILESDNAPWWIHHRGSVFTGEPRTAHSRAYQMYCHAVRNSEG